MNWQTYLIAAILIIIFVLILCYSQYCFERGNKRISFCAVDDLYKVWNLTNSL